MPSALRFCATDVMSKLSQFSLNEISPTSTGIVSQERQPSAQGEDPSEVAQFADSFQDLDNKLTLTWIFSSPTEAEPPDKRYRLSVDSITS